MQFKTKTAETCKMANERERLGEWDFVFCMIWNVQCDIVTSAGGLQCLEMPMVLDIVEVEWAIHCV